MIKTRNQPKTEIQSAALYRCTDKQTHEVFYLVKSDSSEEYYRLTWNNAAARYECSCPATKPCKHMRAVSDVAQAKAERVAANIIAEPLAAFELPSDKGFDMRREQEKIAAFTARATQAKIVKSWETAEPIYGTCGHLARRADRSCGCC